MNVMFTICWFLIVGPGAVDCKTNLYIGALFGLSDHWFAPYSQGFVDLFKRAFEEINNRTDILADYDLHLVVKDTKIIPGEAAKRLYELIMEQPTKIALLGPMFSDEVILIGQITPFYNLVQMNFVAGTSTIKDRKQYSSVYINNFIQDDLNPLRVAIMKYFKWNRVATLIFNDDFHKSQIDEFHELLNAENLTLLTSSIVSDPLDVAEHIRRLKQYEARIIVAAFRTSQAPYIFCEAYKQNFYGHKYVWILTASSLYDTWTTSFDASDTSCTKEQILTAANGYITLAHKYLGEDNITTFTGKTPEEYNDFMKAYLAPFNVMLSRTHPYGYDSAWALALGLNNSLQYLNGSNLEDFIYNRSDIFESISRGMEKVNFYGVSGPLSYNKGRRIGLSYIQHNVDFQRTIVGKYNPQTDSLSWSDDPHILFNGLSVPKDSFIHRTKYSNYSIAAMSSVLILDVIGLVVACFFLVFNIMFRNNKHIKMSSPRINNLIITGTIVMYGWVCLSAYEFSNKETSGGYICMMNVWVYSLGFTLVFGALFSKTWRVHVLFRQHDFRKKTIKDTKLFALVGVLVGIDVVILLCWSLVHPLQKTNIEVERKVSDDDVILTEIFSHCHHSKYIYWLVIEYIYKGLLLVFGTFLAWETRKINVPALNDSKLIGFCVYNIVLMCSLGVPINLALTVEQFVLRFALISILTIFCTTLVLCILFIPKMSLRNSTENIKFVKSLNEQTKTTEVPSISAVSKHDDMLKSKTVMMKTAKPDLLKDPVHNTKAELPVVEDLKVVHHVEELMDDSSKNSLSTVSGMKTTVVTGITGNDSTV